MKHRLLRTGLALGIAVGLLTSLPRPAAATPSTMVRSAVVGGTVWAWGANNRGELGNGTLAYSNVPRPVPGLSHVVAVSAAQTSSLALEADGTVWAWGSDDSGQLGLPAAPDTCPGWNDQVPCSRRPVQVRGLPRISAIYAYAEPSLALATDGTVWGWGLAGNLGGAVAHDGLIRTPMRIPWLHDIAALAGDDLFITREGRVLWWTGAFPPPGVAAETLAPVAGLAHVIGATFGNPYKALEADGTVWLWDALEYPYGDLSRDQQYYPPIRMPYLDHVAQIADSFAVTRDGTLWAWGSNGHCALGIGVCPSNTDCSASNGAPSGYPQLIYFDCGLLAPRPVLVHLPARVAQVIQWENPAAIDTTGHVWTWGDNGDGQLGIGRSGGQYGTPQRLGLSHVTALAAGDGFMLALRAG